MDLARRNNIHVSGNGTTTAIFAHGFGCDQTMWRYLIPAFESRYRIVLFDLVGSGSSDLGAYDIDKYSTLHGYATDLLEIIEACAVSPVIFFGHSVSAMTGMLAGITAPEKFLAQVMVGPSPSFINDGDYIGGFTRPDIDGLLETLEANYLGWASAMAPAIMGSPEQPDLGNELTNSFCRTDPDIAAHFARVTFLADHRAELCLVTTPTLILQSSEDILAAPIVGEYMHHAMPGSTLSIVDNVGHCPHMSAPSASVDAINAFLETKGL